MLVFDLETDGLLNNVTTIHCLVIHNTEDNTTHVYNDEGNTEPIIRGITYLQDSDRIVGHNIIGYDLPVLRKLYPFFETEAEVVDTLLLSRLYHPNMMELDKRHNWKHMPLKLYGRHSLESYGYRLGEYKGEFGKTTDWKEWSEEMQDYCIQDVVVTRKLCDHFHPYLNGLR
jgi:hypothetical protein|tara:strand:+ start:2690 stop:3205 length:516 start_codon:yes stop_codon:yes gene_type:complete